MFAAIRAALQDRGRNFESLWAAATISSFGTMLGALTLTALIYLDASAMELGLLAAAASAPVFLVSVVAGVWIDRLALRGVLVFADVGRFVVLLVVPMAALFGELTIGLLYIVTFATGCLTVIFNLAYRSALPQIVPQDALIDANSKLQAGESVASSVGPAAGGAIVQFASGPIAVLVDAMTFLASSLLVGRLRLDKRAAPMTPASPLREAREGFERASVTVRCGRC